MSSEKIEESIRNVRLTTSTATDERIMGAAEAAMAKPKKQKAAFIDTSGPIRRNIMKNKWIKLATAAVIMAAIILGMHILTGPGTSVTIAQMREAMQGIDWMQIINKIPEKKGTQWGWFSFASRIEIVCDPEGRIIYSDFNTGKKLVWNPGNQDIYESDIDERRKFIGDVGGGPFEFITKLFSFLTAEKNWNVTKKIATCQNQEFEIWSASRVKQKGNSAQTETVTLYIDVVQKLPVAWKEGLMGPDVSIQLLRSGEFKYPETGPSDIYEAGAPRSAQIKPAPNP